MNSRHLWLALVLPLIAELFVVANAQEKVPLPQSATIIIVDRGSSGVRYRVDSKNVTRDPLRGIAIAFEEKGGKADLPVIALIEDSLPISILSDVAGMIGKVGFSQPRYFRFRRGSTQIGEIGFGRFYVAPNGVDLGEKPGSR